MPPLRVISHKPAAEGANCIKFTEAHRLTLSTIYNYVAQKSIVFGYYALWGTTRVIAAVAEAAELFLCRSVHSSLNFYGFDCL